MLRDKYLSFHHFYRAKPIYHFIGEAHLSFYRRSHFIGEAIYHEVL